MSDKTLTGAWPRGAGVEQAGRGGKASWGWLSPRADSWGQEVLAPPRKGKSGSFCEAWGLVVRSLLPGVGTPGPVLLPERLGALYPQASSVLVAVTEAW